MILDFPVKQGNESAKILQDVCLQEVFGLQGVDCPGIPQYCPSGMALLPEDPQKLLVDSELLPHRDDLHSILGIMFVTVTDLIGQTFPSMPGKFHCLAACTSKANDMQERRWIRIFHDGMCVPIPLIEWPHKHAKVPAHIESAPKHLYSTALQRMWWRSCSGPTWCTHQPCLEVLHWSISKLRTTAYFRQQ